MLPVELWSKILSRFSLNNTPWQPTLKQVRLTCRNAYLAASVILYETIALSFKIDSPLRPISLYKYAVKAHIIGPCLYVLSDVSEEKKLRRAVLELELMITHCRDLLEIVFQSFSDVDITAFLHQIYCLINANKNIYKITMHGGDLEKLYLHCGTLNRVTEVRLDIGLPRPFPLSLLFPNLSICSILHGQAPNFYFFENLPNLSKFEADICFKGDKDEFWSQVTTSMGELQNCLNLTSVKLGLVFPFMELFPQTINAEIVRNLTLENINMSPESIEDFCEQIHRNLMDVSISSYNHAEWTSGMNFTNLIKNSPKLQHVCFRCSILRKKLDMIVDNDLIRFAYSFQAAFRAAPDLAEDLYFSFLDDYEEFELENLW